MGMVFSKGQNGQGKAIQITRGLPESVKNPRTEAQVTQRFLLSAANKSYAMLKALADHSMQGKSYGQQSMNEFMRINYVAARDAAATGIGFPVYGSDAPFVFEGCVLANGSVARVDDKLIFDPDNSNRLELAIPNTSETAAADYLGLKSLDDVFTVAIIDCDDTLITDELSGLQYHPNKTLSYVRIKLKRTPDASNAILSWAQFDTLFDVSDSEGVELTQDEITPNDYNLLLIGANAYADDSQVMLYTAVCSQKKENGWLRSRAVFKRGFDYMEPSKAASFGTYPIGAEKILNGAGMTRAAAAVQARLGAWQISEAGAPTRGEWFLGVEVDGTPYVLASDWDGDSNRQAIKIGNTKTGNIAFSPTPLTADSRFSTESVQFGSGDYAAHVYSLDDFYNLIAAGYVSNLPMGTVSPIDAATLPTLNAV